MKIINNIIDVKGDDGNNFLIHPYYGEIYVIPDQEFNLLSKWKQITEITAENETESKFLEQLRTMKMTVETDEEENRMMESVLNKCRAHHNKLQKNINNAVFVLTYGCNFACPYCYEHANNDYTTKTMTKEMVDRVFDMYNNHIESVGLYGGEPLLPQNKEIIEYIISKAPDSSYSITTNGYHLIDFIDIIKKLNISNIQITLDGPRELHNKTRILKQGNSGGTYDRIIQGIERLFDIKKRVKIRMNISENNQESCERLRDDFIARYKKQFDQGLLIFELQPIFQLNYKTRDKLNEQILYNHAKRHDIHNYNTMSISVSPILNAFVSPNRKFIPKYAFCDGEVNRRFFDAEGDIYSCILSLKNKVASIGTYYPNISYKDKSLVTRNVETIEQCKQCKLKFFCGGGCGNAIIEKDEDVLNPNCFIKNEVYNVLPKLFKQRIAKE